MSPRAACRLETLGFEHVYDYVAGKADWLAHGLEIEGTDADRPTVGRLARTDVVTCSLDEHVGDVRARVEASPFYFALVVSRTEVLLGRLSRAALEGDPHRTAEEAMEPGPSTVRPDAGAGKLAERLRSRDLRAALVTTPEGVVVGVVLREDLEQRAPPEASEDPG
jgi:Mg/Co/Ni transporter MgtE